MCWQSCSIQDMPRYNGVVILVRVGKAVREAFAEKLCSWVLQDEWEFFRPTRQGRVFIAEGTAKSERDESTLLLGSERTLVWLKSTAIEMGEEVREGPGYRQFHT